MKKVSIYALIIVIFFTINIMSSGNTPPTKTVDEIIKIEKTNTKSVKIQENTRKEIKNKTKKKKKKVKKKNITSKKKRLTVKQFINKIKLKQRNRKGIKGKIIIKTTYVEAETTQTVEGEVIIKKEDKFKIHYIKPTEQYLISNGKKLWVYTPELNQVVVQDVKSSNLQSRFYIEIENSIEYYAKKSKNILIEKENYYELKMIPQGKNKDFDEIAVRVDKNKYLPIYMSMKFYGTKVEVEFKDIKTYTSLELKKLKEFNDKNFEFKIPKDAQLINAEELYK